MPRREWGPAAAAIVTVLVCVSVQVARHAPSGAVGEAGYAKEVERLVSEQRWTEAVRVCRKALRKHPLERRAHLYLSQCLKEMAMPDLALQHLVLSAVPSATDSQAPLLPGPSLEEIDEETAGLDTRYPEAMARDWSHWRRARLAVMAARWPAAQGEVNFLATNGSPAENELSDTLLSAALAIGPDELARLTPQSGAGAIPARLGMIRSSPKKILGTLAESLPGALAVTVGGEFAGNRCLFLLGDTSLAFTEKDSWLVLTIAQIDGAVIREERHALAPLTDERAVVERWLAALKPDALLVACASAEALKGMSADGRTALEAQWGLREMPLPDALLAYVFVACLDTGGMRVIEAVAAAPDVPAMLIIE